MISDLFNGYAHAAFFRLFRTYMVSIMGLFRKKLASMEVRLFPVARLRRSEK